MSIIKMKRDVNDVTTIRADDFNSRYIGEIIVHSYAGDRYARSTINGFYRDLHEDKVIIQTTEIDLTLDPSERIEIEMQVWELVSE